MAIFRIEGRVQGYAWGSTTAIAELLGRPPTGAPEAELWMGAHPLAPSILSPAATDAKDLNALIESDPARYLGAEVAKTYGELPFLFKILAAEVPLSLQAHPSAEQARRGFLREEASGVPRAAPHRVYKDARHKPELVYALTEFSALSGFRPPEEAVLVCQGMGLGEGDDVGARLFRAFEASGGVDFESFFRGVFQLDAPSLAASLGRISARLDDEARLPEVAWTVAPWVRRLLELHPSDPGVLAALLLNFIVLEPGEAMFLPAGNLHAYLQGTALELMSNSDNVLRGGLTQKYVDVEELCSVLEFLPHSPSILRGRRTDPGETVFPTSAREFELALTDLEEDTPHVVRGPEIWLLLEGELAAKRTDSDGASLHLRSGQQAFVGADAPLSVRGRGRLFRARVPAASRGV